MRVIRHTQKNFRERIEQLADRPAYPPEIEKDVNRIIQEVRKNGDSAVADFAEKFDGIKMSPSDFRVSKEEISKSLSLLDSDTKKAIRTAIANIQTFARAKLPKPWTRAPRPGVIVGERFEPMKRVGIYIPGGTAPLVSTVIHTAAIAKTAKVENIVAVTPPGKNGKINPAILYALEKTGVDEVYRLGGVYAIAALAFGTKTIRKVEKIVGPGNAYVTAAKKAVFGEVSIDMLAGPSELMVIADGNGRADYIAADMLSQAEHGSGHEHSLLVTTSQDLVKKVKTQLRKQAKQLSRSEPVKKVMRDGIFFIVVKSLDQAAEIASVYAPEHLEIMCSQAGNVAKKVTAAGAVFIGNYTPEAVGDFLAGPSHVLPTAGSAKYFTGLSVYSFFRRTSIINYQRPALHKELDMIECFAEMEGLDAHGKSAKIRFNEE